MKKNDATLNKWYIFERLNNADAPLFIIKYSRTGQTRTLHLFADGWVFKNHRVSGCGYDAVDFLIDDITIYNEDLELTPEEKEIINREIKGKTYRFYIE